jgi:hypothetical protein
MTITCSGSGDSIKVVVRLVHKQPHYDQKGKHTPYKDVTMPGGAIAIVCENLEWSTPSALVMQVQSVFRNVTANQIHHAWRQMSEEIWKRDDDQITSAQRLLKELEENGSDKTQLFDLGSEVPEGVEILAFVFPAVIEGLQVEGDRIEEIGLDATCECYLLAPHTSTDLYFLQTEQMINTLSCTALLRSTTTPDSLYPTVYFLQHPH